MFHFDPLYWMLIGPALLLAVFATLFTRTTFSRHARTRAASGLTGAEAARRLLEREGVHGVRVERGGGFLGDHYDPLAKALRLSPDVYDSDSLSAIGVACHEAGHALQHAAHYAPLHLRTALVPAVQFGSYGAFLFILLGFVFHHPALMMIGVGLFAVGVVFSLVTLPVEWDASARAKRLMVGAGIVSPREQAQAGQVLNAAFLTYVAAAVAALMELLYYLIRSGLLGGRR